MIKINKKDSIIDVIKKISECKQKEVVLDFPFWHPILNSFTSLKILKNKAWKKDLIIITNNKSSINIWKKLWIKYSQIWDSDLLEYNYSFIEYTKYLFKRYSIEIKQLFWNKNTDIVFNYHKKYWTWNSKIWYFIIWLLISVFLLLFIFYFAVNKTYIYITPEVSIKTKAQNFVFKENNNNSILDDETIKITPISKTVNIKTSFWTSWVNEENLKRSTWKATFYNELKEKVDLLKNTRIETEDWIIFTTDTEVHIPSSTLSSSGELIPWTVEIDITSIPHDSNWKILWTRANIWEWINLTLPWLKDEKDKIYAKTLTEIKWANWKYTKKLASTDIKNSKKILESKLRQQALNELKKQISDDNKNNNIVYDILWVDWMIKYSDLIITWDENLKAWDEIENFELNWTIIISSYIYNTEKVLNRLSTTVKDSILEDYEKLLFVNNKSLIFSDIIYKQSNPIEIKTTAQVEAFFSHNFLNEKNNYINRLKTVISWVNKDDALKILLNNKNISDVKIEIRPFFINKISKISDNIIIKVIEK